MGSWSIGAIRRVIQNGFTALKLGYKARPDGALYPLGRGISHFAAGDVT